MPTLPIETRIKNIQKTAGAPVTGVFDSATCQAVATCLGITLPATDLDGQKKAIQKALGFTGRDVDGLIGPMTLSKLEQFFEKRLPPLPAGASMIVSKKGLDIIINAEISSQAQYNKKYKFPIWPGGDSGVTIGIGYDIGYYKAEKITADWQGFMSATDLATLLAAAGLKGTAAKAALSDAIKALVIPWEAAIEVFYTRSLPAYAKETARIYPGVALLPPDAQAALVSLVYNRGASLTGDRRTEMRNIVGYVASGNLQKIAAEIRAMKRLWGPDQRGLLIRRDQEADLVANATFMVHPEDYIFI